MQYKKWVKIYLTITLSAISLFALFNYAIDPLWTFSNSNRFNNRQPGFDERQLKTNRAYFAGLEQYDTLLIGSSRATYINQHDFKTMIVFNYATVAMYPIEYKGWIDLAKQIKGADFKTIIIGVDFWGSNDGPFARGQKSTTPSPESYFKTTESFFYRYKQLFSMATLEKSMDSIRHASNPDATDYTRDNVKTTIKISPHRKQVAVNFQTGLYANQIYGKAYRYDTQMATHFDLLKKENPHTKFIVFTTPVAGSLFEIIVRSGNLADYKKWLTDLVGTFGEVYDFMGLNSITTYEDHYADLHHFYPYIGTLIADRLSGTNMTAVPKDFGILLTKENLKSHFDEIDRQIQKSRMK